MRLVLLGAPGAGKGTQASRLAKKLNIPHISTGDIFRYNIKNGTPLGKLAKEYIDNGGLVPDEVTVEIIKDRLLKDDCKDGFILDGFPRTIPQAESLDKVLQDMNIKLDYAINVDVADSIIVERLSGRRVCSSCGEIFHIVSGPPKKDGICDVCDNPLMQRDDDKEETIKNRLLTYHQKTEPLIGYYDGKGILATVVGGGNIEQTSIEVDKLIGRVI